MKRYRIITGSAYSGCRLITVYWVQVRKRFYTWEKIKGFEDYKQAKELLDLLDK